MTVGNSKVLESVTTYLKDKIIAEQNQINLSCPINKGDCQTKSKDRNLSYIDENCLCQKKFIYMLSFLKANIEPNVVKYLLENKPEEIQVYEYDPIEAVKSPTKINLYKDKIEKYLNNLDGRVSQEGLSLFFSGPNSTGKTFVSSYILCVALEKGISSFYITFKDFYYLYNQTVVKNNEELRYNSNDVYNYILNCGIIALDEMGKETFTESALVFLEQVIKYRASRNLPTIIISNLNIEQKFDSTLDAKDKSEFMKRYGNSIYEALKVNYFFFIFSKAREDNQRNKARKSWL